MEENGSKPLMAKLNCTRGSFSGRTPGSMRWEGGERERR